MNNNNKFIECLKNSIDLVEVKNSEVYFLVVPDDIYEFCNSYIVSWYLLRMFSHSDKDFESFRILKRSFYDDLLFDDNFIFDGVY